MSLALGATTWLVFLGFGVVLSVIDIREHRLPNKLVAAAGGAGLIGIAASSIVGGDTWALVRAIFGSLIVFGALMLMGLIAPTGLGMGDVKLGAVTGLYLGWLGWSWLFWGTFLGFAMGAVWALGLIVLKRARGSTPIAFGPFLILGVVVSALLAI